MVEEATPLGKFLGTPIDILYTHSMLGRVRVQCIPSFLQLVLSGQLLPGFLLGKWPYGELLHIDLTRNLL